MPTASGTIGAMFWGHRPAATRQGNWRLTVRGEAGAVLWGHRHAALLGPWTITKQEQVHALPVWHLAARVTRSDAFQCRQRPLLFTAYRDKGLWCWGIESLDLVGDALYAVLGQPEQ